MQDKIRVLFVCAGNVYRSAIAEQLFRKLVCDARMENEIDVFSRGLQGFNETAKPRFPNLCYYTEVWDATKQILEELEISLKEHVATPLSLGDIAESDFVLAADNEVYSTLSRLFPRKRHALHSFAEFGGEILDPVGKTDPLEHEKTILSLQIGVAQFFQFVRAK